MNSTKKFFYFLVMSCTFMILSVNPIYGQDNPFSEINKRLKSLSDKLKQVDSTSPSLDNGKSFTFLEIGKGDDSTSAKSKIEATFKVNVERPYGALSGFDNQSDVIGNQLEYVNKQMSNIKKVANYYRELIEFVAREVKGDQLKEMESIAMGVEIDPLQKDSMYMQGFSFMKRNYVSTLVFSSYNKKILRINILIKSDSYEGVVENLLKKYGESNMLVMRSNDHEWLRYWQSGADFMVINRGDLLWDYGNQRRPMFMTEIGFYFGDNIKEWKDTTFNIIKKNKEDEKIKKMEKSRKKTQAF